MNLLDKYVAEIGKYLPRRNRADIEAEIRSTLEDMLDERKQSAEATEAETVAVLKEYGAPRKVAASYGAVQYLIGPRLYPTFALVLKIVITTLGMVALIGFGFSVVRTGLSGPEMSSALAKAALELVGTLFSAFGNLVLVFAILERMLPVSVLDGKEKDWNPADLAKEPDPNQVKYAELIASIVFTLIFVVILNRYSEMIGFGFVENGKWIFISVLSPAFSAYVLWINLLCLLSVTLNLWLLRKGNWDIPTRLTSLAIKLGNIVLVLFMLVGHPILAVSSASLAISPEKLDKLETLLGFVIIPTLLAVLLSETIDVIKIIRRLLTPRPPAPFEVRR